MITTPEPPEPEPPYGLFEGDGEFALPPPPPPPVLAVPA